MYIGTSTKDPPLPTPPINRKKSSDQRFHAKAHPTAEITYNNAITRKLSRLPYFCPGRPDVVAPSTVPISAIVTVKPSSHGVRRYVRVRASVVPEITAVSNPNNNPPRAPTIVL